MPFWAILALQGVVFVIWAYSMFRMLFSVRRIAVEDTGKAYPGPIAFLAAFTAWLHDPTYRTQRKMLFVSLPVLIGLSVLSANRGGLG